MSTSMSCIFATPTFDFNFCMEFKKSWTETLWELGARGVRFGCIDRGGDAYLAKVRSKLATEFLEDHPTVQNFFFLDADIGWEAQKVVEFLERPEDIVCGIYPKKSDDLDFPVELCVDMGTGDLIERKLGDNRRLLQALSLPTGFMRIKRHVLELIATKSRKFLDTDPGPTIKEYYNIFEMGASFEDEGKPGWWWGEDYAFCRKCRLLGIEMWVDPDIQFTHRGSKKWKNSLAPNLDRFRDRAKDMKVVQNATPDGAEGLVVTESPAVAEVARSDAAE